MEICENKKVVCRYPLFEGVVQEHALFGWTLSEKILLNRFGSPVPYGVTFDEGDLKEKCSYELSFTRVIESKKVPTLNELHERYNALELKPTKFAKKKIVGLVWLSIAFFAFLLGGLGASANGSLDGGALGLCVFVAFLAAGGCAAIITTGVIGVKKAKKVNVEILTQKRHLVLQAKKVLDATDVE